MREIWKSEGVVCIVVCPLIYTRLWAGGGAMNPLPKETYFVGQCLILVLHCVYSKSGFHTGL